uniref:Uncharacterized protein n=1 Tax=Odontella aurita TaxID=265563 RepID=A0A7S4MT16_9STRA|mmetsp:Transcript_31136/g.93359  ORF Transcript_31136/g.93359 Transcript_31136/m.93359 type:complete len:231 (+) Transcript_31136:327-1019(+)
MTTPEGDGGGQSPLDAFFGVFQSKLISASRSGRHKAAWQGENASQYASERQIVREHYMPFMWGIGCAFVTFTSFQVSRRYRLNLSNKGRSRFGAAAIKSEQAFGEDQERKMKLMEQAVSVPIDLVLSLVIGCSGAFFLLDIDRMRDDFSRIPLVKGRSLLSEELCADYSRESYRFSSVMNKPKQDDPTIDAIREFVSNCQRRAIYEDQLRKERTLTSSDPVSVPWPGVPP